MNISLTPEMEKWIEDQVKSGLYASSSEVVRAGLRKLMVERDPDFPGWTREELLAAIAKSDADLKAGRYSVVEDVKTMREEIKQRALARRAPAKR